MRASWLSFPKARPDAAVRLVCLPHAGGGTVHYHPLASMLPDAIELRAVRLPGREARLNEAPFTRMPPLVAALTDALEETTQAPYAFFGHSLGALIAFEVSREIRRRGLPLPRLLIVSGRHAPTVSMREPPLHLLSDDAFVAELTRRYDGIPQVVLDEPSLMALFVPLLRADFALFETHEHRQEPRLECKLGIYGGVDDPQTEHMAPWADLFAGPYRHRGFAGGHFYFNSDGARAALAAALAEDVADAIA